MCSLEIPRLKLVANKRCGVAFAANMKDCRVFEQQPQLTQWTFSTFFFLTSIGRDEDDQPRIYDPSEHQLFVMRASS
jgi:hypothetical protein